MHLKAVHDVSRTPGFWGSTQNADERLVRPSHTLQVKVFWPAMGRWYIGRVSAFDSKTGRHTVQFKDGDKREYTLRHEAVVWLDVPGLDRASRLENGWHTDEVSAP